jgi:hypothetical protein
VKPHDEKLIWEAYVNEAGFTNWATGGLYDPNDKKREEEIAALRAQLAAQQGGQRPQVAVNAAYKIGEEDDVSHGQYKGPQDLEPLARMEPRELGDEEEELESFEEGDDVEIHPRVGGGKGSVVEMSPSGTHGIIELSEDMEDGLSQGDRVAVHISDLSHVDGEEEPVDVDDLDPEDDVPYEEDNEEDNDDEEKTTRPKIVDRGGDPHGGINEDCGCGGPEVHGHGKPEVRGMAIKMSDDDMTDDKKPVIKVVKLKKKPKLPSKIMRAIKGALGLESMTVKEEYDEDFERDEAHSTAGLAPFSSSEEGDGWSPAETIEWHSKDVIKAGADYLGQDLLDPKVNTIDDIHDDQMDDLAGMVIDKMQKAGQLGKHLDYDQYMDERDEYKEAIEDHLTKHFDEMIDIAEDKAVERGDRPPLDSGVDDLDEDPSDPGSKWPGSGGMSDYIPD